MWLTFVILNWSDKYSDFDLHVIVDYTKIDENYELVEKLCDYAKKFGNGPGMILLSQDLM
jgi:hypothetical protein